MKTTQKTPPSNQAAEPKVVVVGGGTGSYVVLSGLKHFDYHITAITTVSDDGGSTGRLRDEFGFLPVGDMRQCIAALSQQNGTLRDLLVYRFEKGEVGLKGHNLGNLIITALEDITGSESKALEMAGKIFTLKGQVLPISLKSTKLGAEYSSGEKIISEHQIEEHMLRQGERIVKLFTEPKVSINPQAAKALDEADYIILGPGDLYDSTIANLIVQGAKKTIKNSHAKIIQIMNLMTLKSQTAYFKASDHVSELEKYCGRKVDYILINKTPIPDNVIKIYQANKEYPVEDDLQSDSRVWRYDLLSEQVIKRNKADPLKRSLVRHSSEKIVHVLNKIIAADR